MVLDTQLKTNERLRAEAQSLSSYRGEQCSDSRAEARSLPASSKAPVENLEVILKTRAASDIKELKIANKFYRDRSRQLQQKIKNQQSLLHDIKNPLTSLNILLETNQESAKKLTLIVSDMLNDFYPQKNVSILETALCAQNLLSKDLHNTKVTIQGNIKTCLFCHESKLIRTFINLFKNAITATKTIKTPQIDIEIIETKKNTTIKFKDNGIGIKKEYISRIFESGFSNSNSTGLGLSFCKDFVEKELLGHIYYMRDKMSVFVIEVGNK